MIWILKKNDYLSFGFIEKGSYHQPRRGDIHPAQGNTLGMRRYHKKEALQGRHINIKEVVSPLQGCLYDYRLAQG